LDYKKFELFQVKRNIRDISYKLELPKIIRIYLIFYILLLESVDLDTLKGLAPKFYLDTQQKEYKVKAIFDIRL
jgi:hypothetical protein